MLNVYVKFLPEIFIFIMFKFISRVFPFAVKSATALANAFRASWVVYLSREHELAIGTGLQKTILNPFW